MARWRQRIIPYVIVVVASMGFSYQTQRIGNDSKRKLEAEVLARQAAECQAIRVENGAIIGLIPKDASYYQRVSDALGFANDTICRKVKV